MNINKIVIISGGYPTKSNPVYAFVQPFVHELADMGIECTVIAPQSYTNKLKGKNLNKIEWIDKTEQGNCINVFQPTFISMSNIKLLGLSPSIKLRDMAINSVLRKIDKPDIIYSYFWDFGIAVSKFSKNNNIPLVVASGESKIRVFDYYSRKEVFEKLSAIKGVVCVSTKNLEESESLGLFQYNPNKIVAPNAIDPSIFYKENRMASRQKLSLDKTDFIISFVGAFNNRKGVNRVIKAVENTNSKVLLIGSGEDVIESENVIFKGKVSHDRIRTYLCASNCFVLPTLAEGCCNSIIEAMACGLPIISSDRNFNYDILDDSCALLVEPDSIDEISKAINRLNSDSLLCEMLGNNSLEKAKLLTIANRTRRILDFIQIVRA